MQAVSGFDCQQRPHPRPVVGSLLIPAALLGSTARCSGKLPSDASTEPCCCRRTSRLTTINMAEPSAANRREARARYLASAEQSMVHIDLQY